MAEPAPSARAAGAARYLTFCVGPELYALPADEVSEVIRVPPLARLPQGPRSLLGLGNLRGSVLPIASARGLLGQAEGPPSRAIVLAGAAPVALAVDSVQALVSVEPDQVEAEQAQLACEPGEQLRGAFRTPGSDQVVKVLDIQPLLEAAFTQTARPSRRAAPVSTAPSAQTSDEVAEVHHLVTFEAAAQEFALPLGEVQEIIQLPGNITRAPRAESLVLGLAAYRETLLPLLSLRGLLGLPAQTEATGLEKVLVLRVGEAWAGVVVDGMRAIVPADPALIEPTPPMLAARVGGESRITAIYRGDAGRRLISILSKDLLFRGDVMQRLQRADRDIAPAAAEETRSQQLQFVVFRLGEEEYGLPIAAVEEVAPAPQQITRVPKTPDFLEGVINLRGDVLPVVDQRRRFEMDEAPDREARRLLVVRSERHRAGLIVDSVSEVLRAAEDAIEPAPDLAGETKRLVYGVLNLEHSGRLVLLLDPSELLTRSERGLLDAFEATTHSAAP